MTVTKRKFLIFFTLLVQSAISTCAPIKIQWTSPKNYYTKGFPHFTTPRTFIWPKYTVGPFIPKKYTSSPVDYRYKKDLTDTTHRIWVFYGIVGLIFLLIFLLKNSYFFKMEANARESQSRANTSPIIPPSENSHQHPQNILLPQGIRNSSGAGDGAYSGSLSWESRGVSSLSTIGDRPPGYSDVVSSDLNGEKPKFPEVFPKLPEAPPPKYQEGPLQRY